NAAFQGGFAVGEQGASRFTLPGSGAYRLTGVRFLFGGDSSQVTITLHIYDDSASTDTPGSELFTQDYLVTGNNSAMQMIDLSGNSVSVSGPFRVGIEFTQAVPPSIARDTDGTIADAKNFIFAIPGGWVRSSSLGLSGDWILRAIVEPLVPPGDAGSP